MIRTGIFGGSFNPIHLGHTAIADAVVASGLVDELWLMVSPQNPLKRDRRLLDDQLRLRLARLAVEGHEGLSVCDLEYELPRPSYMVHTLEELCRRWPDRLFSLVIGADNWLHFDHWYRHDLILARHGIIVYPREGYPIRPDRLPTGVTYLDMPLYPVSSTQIRQALRDGQDCSRWLDPRVETALREALNKGETDLGQ